MLRELDKSVDALPFAGKYAVGAAMRNYVKSEPGHEKRKLTAVETLLGGMAVAHTFQAKLGVTTSSNYIENIATHHSSSDVMMLGVSSLYAAANVAVATRQLRLMPRAASIAKRRLARHEQTVMQTDGSPSVERVITKTETAQSAATRPLAAKKMLAALAFTLAGQGAFIYSAHEAVESAHQDDCIEVAQVGLSSLASYQQSSGYQDGNQLISLAADYADYCQVSPDQIQMP